MTRLTPIRLALVGLAAAALAGLAFSAVAPARPRPHAPAAATAVGPDSSAALANCKLPKADFITNEAGPFSTASASFAAVPGMTKVVKVGGTTASCVLVAVSGAAFAPDGEREDVAVTLDGGSSDPSGVDFAENDLGNAASTHAALFAFPGVAPGNHTLAMVFRSDFGGTVTISVPAMRIDHA